DGELDPVDGETEGMSEVIDTCTKRGAQQMLRHVEAHVLVTAVFTAYLRGAMAAPHLK
ncbi:unnamed protein product, partial [Prorocentrum cordatum]